MTNPRRDDELSEQAQQFLAQAEADFDAGKYSTDEEVRGMGKKETRRKAKRRRRCRSCREWFIPARMNQWVCSPKCALAKVRADAKKAKRKELREAKAKAKTRGQWQKEAQAAFNRYIRARDRDLPCVSCGRYHKGKWNAGHFRSVGANPALRFDEANVNKQCEPCNNYLHGNLTKYREDLIRRVGVAEVERLEGPQEPKKYTIEELQQIKSKYTKLARDLTRKQGD